MSIEQVPIDPEVMVEYVSGALRGCAGAVSEGSQELYREAYKGMNESRLLAKRSRSRYSTQSNSTGMIREQACRIHDEATNRSYTRLSLRRSGSTLVGLHNGRRWNLHQLRTNGSESRYPQGTTAVSTAVRAVVYSERH